MGFIVSPCGARVHPPLGRDSVQGFRIEGGRGRCCSTSARPVGSSALTHLCARLVVLVGARGLRPPLSRCRSASTPGSSSLCSSSVRHEPPCVGRETCRGRDGHRTSANTKLTPEAPGPPIQGNLGWEHLRRRSSIRNVLGANLSGSITYDVVPGPLVQAHGGIALCAFIRLLSSTRHVRWPVAGRSNG